MYIYIYSLYNQNTIVKYPNGMSTHTIAQNKHIYIKYKLGYARKMVYCIRSQILHMTTVIVSYQVQLALTAQHIWFSHLCYDISENQQSTSPSILLAQLLPQQEQH